MTPSDTTSGRPTTRDRQSLENFSQFLEMADFVPALIAVTDRKGEIRFMNKRGADWLGAAESTTGRNLLELMRSEDRDGYLKAEVGPEGMSARVEARMRFHDGADRWLSFQKGSLGEAGSDDDAIIVMASDAHETHLRQEGLEFALESSRTLSSSLDFDETLRSALGLLSTLGDWVAIYLYAPDASLKRSIFHAGSREGQWTEIGRPGEPKPVRPDETMLFSAGQRELVWDPDARIDADMKQLIGAAEFHLLINTPLVVLDEQIGCMTVLRKSPLYSRSESGRRVRLFGMRVGMALGNAKLYAEARERSEELERISEAKSEFLGLVSHELRNPLTVIYGGLESLVAREDLSEGERTEVLLSTQRETRRLRYLVEDLLALSKIETKGQSELEPVLLQRQIRTIMADFADRWRNNVLLFVDDDLPPVWGEITYIAQIVRNLVDNADKYSPKELPIEVNVHRRGAQSIVSVSDHGPGVPADELAHIFERFYRGADPAGRSGLGLGLTVCQRLVEAQGGRIWPEARPDGGLIVSFSLEEVDL